MPTPNRSNASPTPLTAARRTFRYYDLLLVTFVVVLLLSNLVGAGKVTVMTLPIIGTVSYSAGVLFFPISYFFGDVMTEVYGYAHDRRAVWAGFGALIFAAIMSAVIIALPPLNTPEMNGYQGHLSAVFGNTPRIVLASMLAFCAGSFMNAVVLAKLKIWTSGKYLWLRTIGSTAVGEAIDSSLFYLIAFYAIWPTAQIVHVALMQYILKTVWEIIATPLTYWIIARLKRAEQYDHYDRGTNFTPFRVKL